MKWTPLAFSLLVGCASSTIYFPQQDAVGPDGVSRRPVARKAIQLYGDTYGDTRIRVTRNSVEFRAGGGIDNSTTTNKIFDSATSVARWTIGWGFSYGILNSLFGHAGAAYSANQAAHPATVTKAAPLPSVGSTIPAQTSAVVTPVP